MIQRGKEVMGMNEFSQAVVDVAEKVAKAKGDWLGQAVHDVVTALVNAAQREEGSYNIAVAAGVMAVVLDAFARVNCPDDVPVVLAQAAALNYFSGALNAWFSILGWRAEIGGVIQVGPQVSDRPAPSVN
jgi:hypothetical protein